MSLDRNVGIITSEAALPIKCLHELRGEHQRLHFRGYFRGKCPQHSRRHRAWKRAADVTFQRLLPGKMPITSEMPSSVEGSSGGKTPEVFLSICPCDWFDSLKHENTISVAVSGI